MGRSRYIPRTRMHTVWLSPARSPALMLTEIRDHADRGAVVQVIRAGGGAFQVVRNGELWLTRTAAGEAVATMDTVGEAVTAGNRSLDAPTAEDDFDDHPQGAA